MSDKIKDSLVGASRLEKRLGRIAESIQELQDKIGHSPKEIFNPMVEERIAGARHSELLRHRRSLDQRLRSFYKIATPSDDFAKSIDRTKSMLQHGISTARAVAMKRSFDREIITMFGKAGRAAGSGNAPRIQFSQLELNNRVQAKNLEINEKKGKIWHELYDLESKGGHLNKERISDLKKELELTVNQEKAVKAKVEDNRKLIQQTTMYSPWRAMGTGRRARLNISGQVPLLEPKIGGYLVKGAKYGFTMMRPFGPIGEFLGAGIGGVIGGARGLFARRSNTRRIRRSQSIADARQMMLPGSENDDGSTAASAGFGAALGAMMPDADVAYAAAAITAKIASAGYNLAKSGFGFQQKGIFTALGFGKGNRKGLDQFQRDTGINLAVEGGRMGWMSGAAGGNLSRLGVGPSEALDLASTYGAFNTKGNIPLGDLATATRSPFLAGVGAEGLSQVGRWGTRALGMDPDKLFPILAGAVEKGMKSGMTAPEVAQTFLSMSKAMAVGAGVGMGNVGGMFDVFNNLRGKVAEFNTSEGMIRAASGLAGASSQAVNSPFGFALMQKGILDLPGKTYGEKFSHLPGFSAMKKGMLPGELKLLNEKPNFMSTKALGDMDIMGPSGGYLLAEVVKRMTKNLPMQFETLNSVLHNASLSRTLLDPTSLRKLELGGMGTSSRDTESLTSIDETTKAMLGVLNVIALPEALKYAGASKVTGPAKSMLEDIASIFGLGPSSTMPSSPPHTGPGHYGWGTTPMGTFGLIWIPDPKPITGGGGGGKPPVAKPLP